MRPILVGFILLFSIVCVGITSCSSTSTASAVRTSSDLPAQDFLMSFGNATAELNALRVLFVANNIELSWANYHTYFFAYHTPTTGDPNVFPCPVPLNSWQTDWGLNSAHPWPTEVINYFTGYRYLLLGDQWYSTGG